MGKEYDIAKTTGTCTSCEEVLDPAEQFVAIIRERGEEFVREDYCLSCWDARDSAETPSVLAVWRTRIAAPGQKKKLFVDDELLMDFFERLDGADDDAKLSFRYVLALVLMRKRRLVYDGMERGDDGTETWRMHFKGSETVHRVIDPKMDEEKIAQVTSQLGQILEGEL